MLHSICHSVPSVNAMEKRRSLINEAHLRQWPRDRECDSSQLLAIPFLDTQQCFSDGARIASAISPVHRNGVNHSDGWTTRRGLGWRTQGHSGYDDKADETSGHGEKKPSELHLPHHAELLENLV